MFGSQPKPDNLENNLTLPPTARDEFEIDVVYFACEHNESGSDTTRNTSVSNCDMDFASNMRSPTVGRARILVIWSLLLGGVVANMTPPATTACNLSKPGASSQPSTSTTSSHRNAFIDTIIFGSGSLVCLGLVVGARYWRGSWGVPAPTMGASGIAFLLWKNDSNISAEVTWMWVYRVCERERR